MGSAVKGALINFGAGGGTPVVILFQYNPQTLTRTVPPSASGSAANLPARETIGFTLSLDAIDLDAPIDPATQIFGVLPTLTALEELTEQSRSQSPPDVLFVWGPHRILVVRLVSLLIRETQFNPQLAPVQADVDVVLNVLDTLAQGAPPAIRQAHQENQAARERFLAKLPREFPDYINRILK
jgi:hypothetical protein